MKKIKLIAFAFLVSQGLHAQQGNVWCFGTHAGLNFNTGTPVPFSGSALTTQEGCASISDQNGNLLFYTDGSTVYTKIHIAMPNGTGLMGGSSSTQSGLILPKPGSSTEYYVFTMAQQQHINGCRFSIVDMTLNSGNGDVTIKNSVVNNTGHLGEKLTATHQANGLDYWLAIHKVLSDTFFVYPVTASGVGVPLISMMGTVYNGVAPEMGYMKFSPDGNKLAAAVTSMNKLDIFDFDKATGVISNPITFNVPTGNFPYGVEFSPDASKLYLLLDQDPAIIYQLDMNAGSPAAILASAQSVHSYGDNGGALQTGPDGKIYFVRYQTNWIGVINNPNAAGAACNPVTNGVMLGTSQVCQLGFPDMLPDYFYNPTGMEETTHTEVIDVFPNPFTNMLHVKAKNKEALFIRIYDLISGVVLANNFSSSISLNTDFLSNSIYIYEVSNKEGVIKKGKLLKQ